MKKELIEKIIKLLEKIKDEKTLLYILALVGGMID